MGTTTAALPLRRSRPRGRRVLWVIGGVVLLAVIGVGAYLYLQSTAPRTTRAASSTYVVARGNLVASVAGSGSVATNRSMELSFGSAGTVTEVAVSVGDAVKAGQALARIESDALAVQVSIAQANLTQAEAQLAELQGGASAADLSSAKLSVVNAEMQLQQLTEGPTAADAASARASQISAQADLAELQAGADPLEVQNARDDLERAKNSLWSAQMGRDATCGADNKTTQCDQANISVASGEISVRQAQAKLDDLLAGPTDTEMQLAELAVRQANARLAELYAKATAKELEAAQLQLENTQARLAEVTAGATTSELAQAQASVDNAKLQLLDAQEALDDATLRAPFDGIITEVNVIPGGTASANSVAVSILDRSELHVDLKLTESNAVKVQAGQSVTLTFDSLDEKALPGIVRYVSPVAETNNGVVTYAVRVALTADDEAIRVGMTANVTIVTAQQNGVLLVPNTALLPQDDGSYLVVLVSRAQGSPGGQAAPSGTPGAPGQGFPGGAPPSGTPGAGRPGASGTPGARGQGFPGRAQTAGQAAGESGTTMQVPVQIGLSDGTYTEVLSGLGEGDVIEALATVTTSGGNNGMGGPGGFGMPIMGGIFGGR